MDAVYDTHFLPPYYHEQYPQSTHHSTPTPEADSNVVGEDMDPLAMTINIRVFHPHGTYDALTCAAPLTQPYPPLPSSASMMAPSTDTPAMHASGHPSDHSVRDRRAVDSDSPFTYEPRLPLSQQRLQNDSSAALSFDWEAKQQTSVKTEPLETAERQFIVSVFETNDTAGPAVDDPALLRPNAIGFEANPLDIQEASEGIIYHPQLTVFTPPDVTPEQVARQIASSMGVPTEVPLRATHASRRMRRMMSVFRLDPFAAPYGTFVRPGEDVDVGRPLVHPPMLIEWQVQDWLNDLADAADESELSPSDLSEEKALGVRTVTMKVFECPPTRKRVKREISDIPPHPPTVNRPSPGLGIEAQSMISEQLYQISDSGQTTTDHAYRYAQEVLPTHFTDAHRSDNWVESPISPATSIASNPSLPPPSPSYPSPFGSSFPPATSVVHPAVLHSRPRLSLPTDSLYAHKSSSRYYTNYVPISPFQASPSVPSTPMHVADTQYTPSVDSQGFDNAHIYDQTSRGTHYPEPASDFSFPLSSSSSFSSPSQPAYTGHVQPPSISGFHSSQQIHSPQPTYHNLYPPSTVNMHRRWSVPVNSMYAGAATSGVSAGFLSSAYGGQEQRAHYL